MPDGATLVAERILAALDAPLPLGDGHQRVGVSIGIATVTDPTVAPDIGPPRRRRGHVPGQEGRRPPLAIAD